MTAPQSEHDRLSDIRDACLRIIHRTQLQDAEGLSNDTRTHTATLEDLRSIGEAAEGIDEEWRADHPDIPWDQLDEFRGGVERARVPEVTALTIPVLLDEVQGILSDQD